MCPTKTVLDVETARKKVVDARLISGKPTELSSSAGSGFLYPVNGDLTVFGFKVVRLLFEGSMDNTGKLTVNSGGLFVDVDTSFEAAEKMLRSRCVILRKPNGGPGLVATHPGDQFVSLERQGKLVRFGCGIPID